MSETFVFPADDRDLMQMLELRANNGAVADVETVYVLTGSTYSVPELLFAFDDPGLYYEAERDYVDADNGAIAETIWKFYEGRPGPRMIVDVHTHPAGSDTRPSNQDHSVAGHQRQAFDQYFDDYELFFGIHGLGEACDPDLSWMRVPEQTGENEISWWGENRRHSLAVFDGAYRPRPVRVVSTGGGSASGVVG